MATWHGRSMYCFFSDYPYLHPGFTTSQDKQHTICTDKRAKTTCILPLPAAAVHEARVFNLTYNVQVMEGLARTGRGSDFQPLSCLLAHSCFVPANQSDPTISQHPGHASHRYTCYLQGIHCRAACHDSIDWNLTACTITLPLQRSNDV